MKLFLFNIFIIIQIHCLALHPIHVSVTNIDFNKTDKAFDISIKLYLDDFQNTILKNKNVSLNLGKIDELKNANDYICEYIKSNFSITLNNNNRISNKNLTFNKRKIDDGSLWLYFTFKLSKKIESLEIYNNILNDYYPDMTNLIIIKYNNLENGYSLNKHTTSFKISS